MNFSNNTCNISKRVGSTEDSAVVIDTTQKNKAETSAQTKPIKEKTHGGRSFPSSEAKMLALTRGTTPMKRHSRIQNKEQPKGCFLQLITSKLP
ncbi:hypothetical protein ACHAWX_002332 [Stephanocyclus meneghinianus]